MAPQVRGAVRPPVPAGPPGLLRAAPQEGRVPRPPALRALREAPRGPRLRGEGPRGAGVRGEAPRGPGLRGEAPRGQLPALEEPPTPQEGLLGEALHIIGQTCNQGSNSEQEAEEAADNSKDETGEETRSEKERTIQPKLNVLLNCPSIDIRWVEV